MMWLGDFRIAKTVRFLWNTNAVAGESITRATNGTVSVYKDGGTTQSTTGVTDTEDFDALTGVHLCAIDTSADGTFYSAGSDFAVVLSAATIDGKSINAVLAHFSLENRSNLMPTTDGRKLDVSTGGEAGVDWANVGSPTTSVTLSGTTVGTVSALASGSITAAVIATDAIDADAIAANAIDAGAIATGAITAAKFAAGAIDAAALAADASTEIRSVASGTADSGTTTTMVDAARTEADDDYWKGMLILFTSGTIAGQARLITGFTASSDTITFAPATTQAVGTNTYEILPAGRVDLNSILGTAVSTSTAQLGVNVVNAAGTAWGSGAITAGVLASDCITAAKIATDAIDADAIADNAINAAAIATGAITAAKFAAGAIDAAAIADGAIDAATFAAGAINAAAIASDAITDAKVASDVTIASVTGSVGSVTATVNANVTQISGDTAAADNAELYFDGTGFGPILVRTTVTNLVSQTVFDLTAGAADDDAYNYCVIVIEDQVTAAQKAVVVVDDYAGATKTVTLRAGATFTVANGDIVTVIADRAMKALTNGRFVRLTATGGVSIDWANVENPTTVLNLSGTTVKTATDVETDTADIQSRLPAALVSGRIDASVGAMAANTLTATAIDTGAITSAKFAAGAIDAAAIADGAIDRATFAADTGLQAVRSNTAQAGGATSITLDASASATTDFYKHCLIYLTGGTGAGQYRFCTAYNGTSKAATVTPAWATNPDNTSTFAVLPAGSVNLEAILGVAVSTSSAQLGVNVVNAAGTAWGSGAITAASIATDAITAAKIATGAIDADAIAADAITAAKIADGAIDAATFAAGAINAAAIAADAITDAKVAADVTIASVTGAVGSVTGNVGGNVVGSVGSLATQAKADVNAEVVDCLATDTYAEPGQGTPAATTTLSAKINYLYKTWRNKKTQTSSTFSLFADDTTTVDQKATVSDDGTTTTINEVATGP